MDTRQWNLLSCRVGEASQWVYDSSKEILESDSTTQRTCIEWHKVGDEFHVPGRVVDALYLELHYKE